MSGFSFLDHVGIRRDIYFYSPVLCPSFGSAVIGHRLIECKAFGRQTGTADSLAYQKVSDGICTFFRNAFVYCTGTGIVGMTVDGHVRIRIIFQGSGELRQGFSGSRTKFALIGGEKDTIVEGYLYGLQVIDILYRLDFSSFDRFQFFFLFVHPATD